MGDCSRRMCPKANDVMDERLDRDDFLMYQIQNITLYAAGTSGNGTNSATSDFYSKTFALTFVSTLNESFTTVPITVEDADTLASATISSLPSRACPTRSSPT